MTEEKIFANGLYFKKQFDNLFKISIDVEKFTDILNAYKNEKGYVNIDIKKKKNEDGYYGELNFWQPKKKDDINF